MSEKNGMSKNFVKKHIFLIVVKNIFLAMIDNTF